VNRQHLEWNEPQLVVDLIQLGCASSISDINSWIAEMLLIFMNSGVDASFLVQCTNALQIEVPVNTA
jgi:hypothetical protein